MKTRSMPAPRTFAAILALAPLLMAASGCNDDPVKTDRGRTQKAQQEQRSTPAAAEKAYVAAESASFSPASVMTAVAVDTSVDTSADASASEIGLGAETVYDASVDYVKAGREAWEEGDFERAVTHLEIAHDLAQARDYDTYLLGLACRRIGEMEAAETWLSEAARKMPNFAKAQVNLARVRIETGDLDGAADAVESALEIDDESAQAYNVQGRILLARGDRDAAFEAFRKASELDPSNPWPLNNLGYAYLIAGDAELAAVELSQAVQIDPDFALAWHNLALAREKTGELDAASFAAKRAEDIDSESATYRNTATRLMALAPLVTPDSHFVSETTVAAISTPPVPAEAPTSSDDDSPR